MKKSFLFNLLLAFYVLACFDTSAQTPNAFSYQFVVRNLSGQLIPNKNIGVKINLHQATDVGTVVYSEKFTALSNQFGLVTLQVGRGTILSGNFSTIDWGANLHFIQLEIDYSGGTTYENAGTSQLVSVPYALNAKNVNAATIPLGASGGILLPQNISTCDGTTQGTLMYNTTTKKVQFCDGTAWKNVDGTL